VTFPCQLWLAAFVDHVHDREMRAYWCLKEEPTPTLDAALETADYLYVGAWGDEHESVEPQAGRCPARRVFDWLFWRGTADRFSAPVLDGGLAEDLLQCFAARPDDLPAPTASPEEFTRS
jgi:hypothetical protein